MLHARQTTPVRNDAPQVRASLARHGLQHVTRRELDTRADGAAGSGTTLRRIVRSALFMASGQPILVLAGCPNRADEVWVAAGTPRKVLRIQPPDPVRIRRGGVHDDLAQAGLP